MNENFGGRIQRQSFFLKDFFGDNSSSRTSATVGALRRSAFAAAGGKDPRDMISDEVAETDIYDKETRLERAHGDEIINELLHEKGANLGRDPLKALRILDGQKLEQHLLRDGGVNVVSPYVEKADPTKPELRVGDLNPEYLRRSQWLRGWDEMVETPLINALISSGHLQANLQTYDDTINFAKTRHFITGGFYTSNHLETALHVIGSAKSSLSVGFYQFEHGALAQAVLNSLNNNVRVSIKLSTPHSLVGRALASLFGQETNRSNFDFSSGKAPTYDSKTGSPVDRLDEHFKFIAADVDSSDLRDRKVWISSANASIGAMGFGRRRPGGGMRGGRNLEGTFLLTYDLVESGYFGTKGEKVFTSLTDQAREASDWMMGERTNFTDFGGFSDVQSKILETHGLRDLYKKLFNDLSTKNGSKVKVYLANYGFGAEFVNDVFQILEAGGEVNILRHPRGETHADEAFRALKRRMADSGIDSSKLKDVVAHGDEFVHMKTSLFEYEDDQGQRRFHQIIGSQNLSNRHYKGRQYFQGGITTKDLSIFLHGEEAVGNRDSASLFMLQMRAKSLFTEKSSRFRTMTDTGWERYQLYGLNYSNIERVFASNTSGKDAEKKELNAIKFKVGGQVSVGLGSDRVSVDLGDLVQLTVKDYGSMGPAGSLFVQELSKFITPSYGVSKYESKDGKELKDFSLDKLTDVTEFSPQETILAAISAAQGEYKTMLKALGVVMGGRRLQQELEDPIVRGKIRQALKIKVRESMEHFAGIEPGVSAYNTKQFARLAFLQRKVENAVGHQQNVLDLTEVPNLDIFGVEDSLTQRYSSDSMYRLWGLKAFFTAGSLTSYSDSGNTPARFYDNKLLSELPMSAIVKRKGSEKDEFMFLLAQDKLMQLPQRLQNILAARNLTPVKELNSNVEGLISKSLLAGQKGDPVEGIKFKGFAVPGLGGDNAYLIGEVFENVLFGDEAYRRQAKLPIGTTVDASLAMLKDKILDLVNDGIKTEKGVLKARRLKDGKVYLDSKILEALGHKLPVGLTEAGGLGATRIHYLDLKTARVPGMGVIIDVEDLHGERDQQRGLFNITVHGQTVRTLVSGDRSIIGGKFPYAFVTRSSKAVSVLDKNASRGLFDPSSEMNAIFGEKVLKTGQAFIETGAELLSSKTTDVSKWVNSLNLNDLQSLKNFAGLFDKFQPYLAKDEAESVHKLLADFQSLDGAAPNVEQLKAKIIETLQFTQSELGRQGFLRFGVDHRAIAGSMLAFGLHTYQTHMENSSPHRREILNTAFASEDNSFPARGVDFSKLTVQQVLESVYMTTVSAPSAAAVALSSRETVNFLHYHSDFYTDSFFGLMSLDPGLRKRTAAYRELLVGGILGGGSNREFVFTPREFNPMTRFQAGFAPQFQRVLEITRELQGYGTRDVLTAEEKANQSVRVKNLMAEYRTLQNEIHTTLSTPQGNEILNETFSGEALREDYNQLMSRTYSTGTKGSVMANEITEFFEVQSRAGVGARTLFVPQLGRLDAITGQFVADPFGNKVRHVEVRFNSPGALLSIGTFDDYAHQMQKLQYDIERKLYTIEFIEDTVSSKGGKVGSVISNYMDETVLQDYLDLQDKIGELAVVQGLAAVSDMQKLMGGRLSVSGRNMIIGTLPEVPRGTMILGKEAWDFMRKGAASEIVEGLKKVASLQMEQMQKEGTGKPTSFSKALFSAADTLLASLRSQGINVASLETLQKETLNQIKHGLGDDYTQVEKDILTKRAEIDAWHAEKQSSWLSLQEAQTSITKQIEVKEAAKAAFLAMNDMHAGGIYSKIQHLKTKITETKEDIKRRRLFYKEFRTTYIAEAESKIKKLKDARTKFFTEYKNVLDFTNNVVSDLEDKFQDFKQESKDKITSIENRKSQFFKQKREISSQLSKAKDRRTAFFKHYHEKKQFLQEQKSLILDRQERRRLNQEFFDGEFENNDLYKEYDDIWNYETKLEKLENARRRRYSKIFRGSDVILGTEQTIIENLQTKLNELNKQSETLYGKILKAPRNNPSNKRFYGYLDTNTGKVIVGKLKVTLGSEDQKILSIKKEIKAFRKEINILKKQLTDYAAEMTAEKEKLYGKSLKYDRYGRQLDFHKEGEFSLKVQVGIIDNEINSINEQLKETLNRIQENVVADLGIRHLTAESEGFLGYKPDKPEFVIVKQGQMYEKLDNLYKQKNVLYEQLNQLNARKEALYGKSEQAEDGTWIQHSRGTAQEAIDALHRERARLKTERDALYGYKLDPNDPRSLTGEMSRIPGSKDRERDILQGELNDLYEKRNTLTASNPSVTKIVQIMFESLLDSNRAARDYFTSGLFQRSGAPPGPMGIVVGKILTVQEYNKMAQRKGLSLQIHETMSARSVFLSSDSMAYNLGDFDGDTGSITWLQQFSRLKVLQQMESVLDPGRKMGFLGDGERQLLTRAESDLNISPEEHMVEFARFYTGLDGVFDINKVYTGHLTTQTENLSTFAQDLLNKESGNIDPLKSYLRGLEQKVVSYARANDLVTQEVNLNETGIEHKIGLNEHEFQDLKAFRLRKSNMFGLATTANEYVGQIYELQDEVNKYVYETQSEFAQDTVLGSAQEQAFRKFISTERGAQIGLQKIVKAARQLAGSGIAGGNQEMGVLLPPDGSAPDPQTNPRMLTDEALKTYFLSTSLAASTLVSKVFEIGFSMSSVSEDSRAKGFLNIREEAETNKDIRKETEKFSMNEFIQFVRNTGQKLKEEGDPNKRSIRDEELVKLHDRLTSIDRIHANTSGIILTLNQIAREAIKPRGGDPLAEIFKFTDNMRNAYKDQAGDFVYGSRMIASTMPRYKGIDRLMQIIHGKSISSGKSVNVDEWTLTSESSGTLGEWNIAHQDIASMFTDYYAGQVNAMYAMAASREDRVKAMLGGEKNPTFSLFDSADQASDFLKAATEDSSTVHDVVKRMAQYTYTGQDLAYIQGATTSKEAFQQAVEAEARSISQSRNIDFDLAKGQARTVVAEKAALFSQIERVSSNRSTESIMLSVESSFEKEHRTKYMAALASGDYEKFTTASSGLGGEEKLKILANSSSRGGFSSEAGMRLIFQDIFAEFGSENQLRKAARLVYANDDFENNVIELFKEFKNSGDILQAVSAMHERAQLTVENAKLKLEQAGADEAKQKIASGELARAEALQEIKSNFMNTFSLGDAAIDGGYLPTSESKRRFEARKDSIADGISNFDKHIAKGGLVSSVSSNFLVPFALSKMMGLTTGGIAGAAGGYIGAPDLYSEAGEFAQMAIQYASPLTPIRESSIFGQKGFEGAVNVAAVGASVGLGALAGSAVGRHAAEEFTAAGINRAGRGAALMATALSAGAGFGVGMAVAVGMEGLLAKFGFLRQTNTRSVSDLVDSGTSFAVSEEALQSEVDDLTSTADEIVVMADANGETHVTGTFYVQANAARDAEGFDYGSSMEADLDTYISASSYDLSGGGVKDSLANVELA
jgi:hypothetical protein